MYLALYRKWRPKTFSDVVSQNHITSTLKNEIQNNKISHCYLFTGPRGTGKTTCAKILAKAINCLHPIDGEPCCKCEICEGLEDLSILDVTEMDGASNNSVNDVRLLRDEANFTPVSCKYRVYIIDEVHMLSISAFNALLKIMEEPPKHVVFILATTEVHKIPETILSRCQRFDFKRIKTTDIKDRLVYITSNEPFNITEKAAYQITKLSDGAMRDAISMLDQCASTTNNITIETVNDLFGILDNSYILDLHDSIKSNDASKGIIAIDKLYKNSKDMQRLCYELIKFYRGAMLSTAIDNNSNIISNSNEDAQNMSNAAKDLTLPKIIEILEILQNCSEKLSNSSNKRLMLELCIIKLCSKDISRPIVSKTKLDKNKTQKQQVKISETNSTTNNENSNENLDELETKPTNIPNLNPLKSWNDILDDIRDKDSTGMLSGFLAGSIAYLVQDKLYISSKNPIVGDKILQKKEFIKNVIKERTGNDYRIFIKKVVDYNPVQNKLDNFLSIAKKAGIEVEEE